MHILFNEVILSVHFLSGDFCRERYIPSMFIHQPPLLSSIPRRTFFHPQIIIRRKVVRNTTVCLILINEVLVYVLALANKFSIFISGFCEFDFF